MISLESIRADTPGCKYKVHFNNAGASLMPAPVIKAMQDHIRLESEMGGYEAAEFKAEEVNGFYESCAQLLNTKARNIAFTSSATNSFARALSCIPFQKGDKILIANEDYISNQLAFLSMAKRFGIELIRAASLPTGGIDLNDLARQMDQHKPRLVSLTHIPTNTGLVQPAEEVGKLCKERDLLYLLDACQSVGQMPVNVQEIQCDFLSGTFRKFLRGPRGAGFLYVSDAVIDHGLEPLFIDMRGADWTDDNAYNPRADARRFEDWELPYALVLGSKAALDYALQIGMKPIEVYNTVLSDLIRQHSEALPHVKLLDHGAQLSSIITLSISNCEPREMLEGLRKRNINTSLSYRHFALIDFNRKGVEWALRISPHYFNTPGEIDILIKALKEITGK